MPDSIVFKTLNYAADLNHILKPRATPKIPHQMPTFLERIAGIVALVLLVPLTLGIGTGFYILGAYLKVSEIALDNRDLRDEKINAVFKDKFTRDAAPIQAATSTKIKFLREALHTIQNGEKETAIKFIKELSLSSLTHKGKCALFETAVQYDRIDIINWLHHRLFGIQGDLDGTKLTDPTGKYEYWYTKALFLDHATSAKMVQKLIALGAKVNSQVNKEGETPIYYARNKEIADLLHKAGARFYRNDGTLFTKAANKNTPLHNANNTEVARFLIETYKLKPKDLNQQNSRRETALLKHIRDAAIAKLLIEKGTNVRIADEFLETPLHRCSDPEVAEMLITKGADLNAKDRSGRFPLLSTDPEVAKVLIKHKANLNLRCPPEGTPLIFHIRRNAPELAILLIEAGADVKACADGIAWTGTDKITKNTSALHLCSNEIVAEKLLEKGADMNKQDDDGHTPLHLHLSFASLFIDYGADVNAVNNRQRTPLHYCRKESEAKVLIKKGANMNAKDDHGCTPLDLAIINKLPTESFLRKNGGKVNFCKGKDVWQAGNRGVEFTRYNKDGTSTKGKMNLDRADIRNESNDGQTHYINCSKKSLSLDYF